MIPRASRSYAAYKAGVRSSQRMSRNYTTGEAAFLPLARYPYCFNPPVDTYVTLCAFYPISTFYTEAEMLRVNVCIRPLFPARSVAPRGGWLSSAISFRPLFRGSGLRRCPFFFRRVARSSVLSYFGIIALFPSAHLGRSA